MPIRLGGYGKFAPVLTLEERCGFFAALRMGVPRLAVEQASGLARSTVSRLDVSSYRAYRDVKGKYEVLGHEEFCGQFLTPEIRARLRVHTPSDQWAAWGLASSPAAPVHGSAGPGVRPAGGGAIPAAPRTRGAKPEHH